MGVVYIDGQFKSTRLIKNSSQTFTRTTIINNQFVRNKAQSKGGDIYSRNSELDIRQNVFSSSIAGSEGGAIAIMDDRRMKYDQYIVNNTFSGNGAQIAGSIFTRNIALSTIKDKIKYTHINQNQFMDNKVQNKSRQVYSYPMKLVLDPECTKNDINKNYTDDVYKSSMNIVSSEDMLNFTFRVID